MIHEFNTGCKYTIEGQVIRWRSFAGDMKTEFLDCSRGIWGVIPVFCKTDDDVLRNYNYGNYAQGGYAIFNALKR